MSATLDRLRGQVEAGHVVASVHGAMRLNEIRLTFGELLESVAEAVLVEDYPDAVRGPSVLVLHRLPGTGLLHAVWGFAARQDSVATLVTVYRPDPALWSADFLRRRG